MEITILDNTQVDNFIPVKGDKMTELLERFKQKLDDHGIERLERETFDILSHCTNPHLNEVQSSTSIVIGYVQSGKTMSFTTLSALAHDNGFRIIIYFAGTKTNLLTQTTKRLRKDLINNGANSSFYKLHENPSKDDIQRIKNELQISTHPTILITVLKHHKYITELSQIFNSPAVKSILGKQGVLIIDDEADQASLNGYARKNSMKESSSEDWEDDEYTTTYSSILNLRSSLPNHSYIQYTATPQGPLLISILDLLSPNYHTVLTPGSNYTGGKTFFVDKPELVIQIPNEQVYNSKRNPLTECPQTLIDALQLHLLGVAIIVKILGREQFLSMMIHADKDQDASRTFYNWVRYLIDSWTDMINCDENDLARIDFLKSFEPNYHEAIREYKDVDDIIPTFEEVIEYIPDIIFDTNIELIISSNKKQGENKEIDWTGNASHILIGAEMLNRGFTVENLAVTYMPRYSIGKSTADTIQQRCRFFGYKMNYLKSCRVFLPIDTFVEYAEYVEQEEEMRLWLKEQKSLEDVEQLLITSPRLNPTRKNILSASTVQNKLRGWRKMNAFQAIEENMHFVEDFLSKQSFINYREFGTDDRNHRYVKLPIQDALQFLSDFKFANMPDTARKQATIRYMKYLSTKDNTPIQHAYIVQMAYKGEARERLFNDDTMRVVNLHSGRSTSGTDVYPGDASIRFEDSIVIQIHKVKLKSESIRWGGKIAYTLAIYYPEDFAINYVTTEGRDNDD